MDDLRTLAKTIAAKIDPLEQDKDGGADELRAIARLEVAWSLRASTFLTGVIYLANRPCTRKRHEYRRALHFSWLDAAPANIPLLGYTITEQHVAMWKTIAEELRSHSESSVLLSSLYLYEADSLQGWVNYREKHRHEHR